MTEPVTTDQEQAGDDTVKLAGFSASSSLVRRLVASTPQGMVEMASVPMLAYFVVDSVELEFVGARHIPMMQFHGTLDRLVPTNVDEMPYRISEISFPKEETVPVVGDYPFTNEQISNLVSKGLYLDGFTPPAQWIGLPFEVDAAVDLHIMPPAATGLPPLVIADLAPMRTLDMREEVSGYELTQYFPDYRAELIDSKQITGTEALVANPELSMDGTGVSRSMASEFDFGDERRPAAPGRNLGVNRSLADQLSAISGVELSGPQQLRRIATRMTAESARSARVRRGRDERGEDSRFYSDRLPGLASGAAPEPSEPTPSTAELSAAVDNVDLSGLNIADFDFGEGFSADELSQPAPQSDTDGGEDRDRGREDERTADERTVDLDEGSPLGLSDEDERETRGSRAARRARIARRAALAQQAQEVASSHERRGAHRAQDSQQPTSKPTPDAGPDFG